jgi:hypothetical protein
MELLSMSVVASLVGWGVASTMGRAFKGSGKQGGN